MESNYDRLLSHLDSESLAARLGSAYAQPGDDSPASALARVMAQRLDELKRAYDEPED